MHIIRGVSYLLLSQVFLVAMDAIAKYLTITFPVIFLVWARYTVLLILILLFIYPASRNKLFATSCFYKHIVRSLFLVATSILGMFGLHELPLAETAGLAFICPLVTILLAKAFLGEQVGVVRWFCMGLGVIGALTIAHPGSSISMSGAICVILAATSFGFFQIMTRQMAASESSATLLVYPAIVSVILLSALVPIFFPSLIGAMTLDFQDLVLVLSLGVLGGIGHYFVNHAFMCATVSSLAPFMYFQLVWAIALGWYFFGQLPDASSFLGMAIIFIAGLVAMMHLRFVPR